MDILDRYLAHVARALPRAKRDVVAEISDELQSQFEERETSLGRALTPDETAEIIRAFGSPRAVAGRYADQQYLIGPDLLPFYWHVLKILIAASVCAGILESAVQAISAGNVSAYFSSMTEVWEAPIWIFGFVTILFALFQHYGEPWPQRWDPRKLAPIRSVQYVSKLTSVMEFFASVAVLIFAFGAATRWEILRGPTWGPVYAAVVVSCCISAIALCITYIQPYWGRLRLYAQVASGAVSAGGLVLGLRTLGSGPTPLRPLFALFLAVVGLSAAVALWRLFGFQRVSEPALGGSQSNIAT